MCPSGSSSLGDVLEARSLFAGKCGDLTLCAADAMVLIGIDGYQGVGHLRLGRVFLSRHQPVEATAAFAACDPFLSQLSPKNAALLMKWRTQCTSVPPIPDAGTGAASSNSRYPSTPHLPFSPQVNEDDIAIDVKASSVFVGVPIVITEKMDGGNCCIMDGKVRPFACHPLQDSSPGSSIHSAVCVPSPRCTHALTHTKLHMRPSVPVSVFVVVS